ncbi:YciE/YciF ferroxidase family protein [Flavobacterium caseinilyticum]|uniref:Ferritin-like domain-containing protein n=1 Tax=Flavobacterium caseinilyticum TaxID=2541732 RepID=A0A4R5ASU4_9FLAO|nr:ferritin-like domain-containing protein [Flavobacterium caseinilyticum]TDD76061.1 ferritin-like domain-containing protein [Flavobacterium caseinilyticum]
MKTTKEKEENQKVETKKGAVKAKPNAAQGLRDFFEDGLKDILWAEHALTKALPKMAKNATSSKLIHAFEHHLKETEEHIARLEKIFESLDLKAVGKKCDAMEGLLKEADGIMAETEIGVVRDAAMIAAAQKVEHYEIATYGTLRAYAVTLGENKAAILLARTLEEEKKADVTLTEIALADINIEAAHADEK